jgi:hypothetical protein
MNTNAFDNATNLTSVKFPSSMTSIGSDMFLTCTNLTTVDFSVCTNLTSIRNRIFKNSGIRYVSFPSSLTDFSNNVFENCSQLQQLTFTGFLLPNFGTSCFLNINTGVIAYMSVGAFNNPDNTASKSVMTSNNPPITIKTSFVYNGITYDILTGSTVAVGNNPTASGSITIPNQVTNNLVTYTVVAVADNAFETNQNITSIDLSECSSLTTIGNFAFAGQGDSSLSSIQTVILPSSIIGIGESAFKFSRLSSINISVCSNISSIGIAAFYNCIYLTSANLSNCTNLTSIPNFAFDQCTSLTSVNLSNCNNLTSIGQNAFRYSKISSITFPSSITNIGSSAFDGCPNLTIIDLSVCTNNLTLGQAAFIYCNNLQSVIFPSNITNIPNQTFNGSPSLENITFTGPLLPSMNSNSFSGIPYGVIAYMTYSAFNNPVNTAYKLVMTSNERPITIEILDPPSPPPPQKKKWIGGNRDSSNVVMQRRQNAIITNLTTPGPQTVNTSDNNVRIDALARVRGGGYTVPPKVTGRIINFNLPTPSGPPIDPNTYFRIIAAGLSATSGVLVNAAGSAYGVSPGFYKYTSTTTTPLATVSDGSFKRSYNVMTINRTTGATNIQSFDVFGTNGQDTALTNYLNGLTSAVIVIVATYDEPQSNNGSPLSASLITAMKNCGASSNFGSSTGTPAGILYYRSSYILVGIPGIGVGIGEQRYVGGNNVTYPQGDPNAFIDLRISVLNGQYTVVSG